MATEVQFVRDYAAFGSQARPFEMDDAVGFVIAEFSLHEGCPFYPIGAILGAKISAVWLGRGAPPDGDESPLDIIFKMREDYPFFELVMRSRGGPRWGGSLYGQALEITDDIVAGHRVLVATADETRVRYEYNPRTGRYADSLSMDAALREAPVMRRMAKTRFH